MPRLRGHRKDLEVMQFLFLLIAAIAAAAIFVPRRKHVVEIRSNETAPCPSCDGGYSKDKRGVISRCPRCSGHGHVCT